MRSSLLSVALVVVASASILGCGNTDESLPPGGGTPSGATGGPAAQQVADAGEATSDEEITLPMVVDFNFFPSGAFGRLIDTGADGSEDDFAEGCDGDDSGEWDNVAIDQTDDACPERPSDVSSDPLLSLSRCSAFTFTPAALDATDQTTWAGVVFQNATCNWGSDPGSPIVAGASRLRFWAWSDSDNVGATIVFQAGGVDDNGAPYRDGFKRSLAVELSDTPTEHEIALSNAMYPMGVISAFGWTAERTTLDPLTFYVDGMIWE